MMVDFREPLLLDVLKRGGRSHAKADQEYICLGIGQGAETIVVLLA